MKLLLDQNLSHRLIQSFGEDFPGTSPLAEVRLQRADDIRVWNFAKNQGFTIISKDTDFLYMSMLHGHPPKVIRERILAFITSLHSDPFRTGDFSEVDRVTARNLAEPERRRSDERKILPISYLYAILSI